MLLSRLRIVLLAAILVSAAAFRPALPLRLNRARAVSPIAARAASVRTAQAPAMGLFGLGAPEVAVIAGIALLILGPEQLKSMAKEVGKVSAELKQVPEEFNKGMEQGQQELEKIKGSSSDAEAEDKAPPPAAPPAA